MTKPKDIGIKISAPGYDVNGQGVESSSNTPYVDPAMVSIIAAAFIRGARAALRRYVEAAQATKQDINNIYTCIYESSNLLENLDIVDRYMEMCGQPHSLPVNIRDMRNHIRHDLRDNLSDPENRIRTNRAKNLGIDEAFMVSMAFDTDEIKIGATSLMVEDVTVFIDEAERFFSNTTRAAVDAGRIKGMDFSA